MVEDGSVNGVGPGISLSYEFDAVGNLWKLRDGKQAEPPLRVYAYDGLDRLTAARDAAGTDQQTYAYDRTGNRTASGYWQVTGTADCSGVPPGDPCTPGEPVSAWKTRTYDYVPQKHHLWTIGYTERHYDATGNTIWIGPKSVEQPPGDGDPGPGDPGGGETESAAYAGTEQSMIGLDDGHRAAAGHRGEDLRLQRGEPDGERERRRCADDELSLQRRGRAGVPYRQRQDGAHGVRPGGPLDRRLRRQWAAAAAGDLAGRPAGGPGGACRWPDVSPL